MMIRDMFADDINRKINGVIKVDQAADDVIEQELNEYVITRELKKHFITFFNYYGDAFDQPTADMGVWISGFFGSGKSHFLKMLSYLLENKEVKGIRSVERFRKKFEDDPATFMLIDRATKGQTETILFNIDIEGFSNKDKTAVLRVFAKMFYNHLGFYGENLKVAMMERYIDQQGKTEEFRRVFEEKKGKPWLEMRRAFAFNGKFIIPTLMEVLDMSEDDAKAWFNDKTATEISIAQLVEDMKAYVDTKPANFRLNTIRLITMVQSGSKFNYNRIRELNPLMDTVRTAHDKMLEEKRAEVLETVRQCMEATHTAANGDSKVSHLIEKSDKYFSQCKEKIAELKSLALLDAMFLPMCQYKDDTVSNIESVLAPPAPKPPVQPTQPGKEAAPTKKKVVRAYNRQVVFQAKTLQTDADIDDYVEKIR